MNVSIRRSEDSQQLRASILQAIPVDYEWIATSGQYLFDWRLERFSDVYKLVLAGRPTEVQGVMSLDDYPSQERLTINQIEVGKSNRGRDKSIDGIAGCLIAFAARRSFTLGYGGVVTLEAKSQLIQHYQTAYGFTDVGHFMVLSGSQAYRLINKYLEDE